MAAAAGYARIGLRLCPPFAGAPHYPLRAGSDALRTLSRLCADMGIDVYDIEAVVIDAEFAPRIMVPTLEAAAELRATRLTVAGDDPDHGRLAANFALLCELASPYGVSVDMENMGWRSIATYAQADALVASAGADNAGVLVDAIHFFRNGGDIAQLRGGLLRVHSVQLCDVTGPAPATSEAMTAEARAGRVAPGEGDLPLHDLLDALPPATCISVEVPMSEPSRSAGEHIRHLMASTQRLFRALSKPFSKR
ncbi:sugar phosphate isomerase/epimerase [Mesorhizobium sp. J428]|uniref:sugar phosphate isomerase/epimerase family protein n=1 Tax=Mesorhizobium sp. J428 TaxID=2898440 RepID=UPI0021511758|nr:sugar phosphate isomerase/epimerase [Mesorhizobium sp. J428]MCR5859943.1 sugar phosphate isomerase/epimerase [Mesorhizobium sp. J428]